MHVEGEIIPAEVETREKHRERVKEEEGKEKWSWGAVEL